MGTNYVPESVSGGRQSETTLNTNFTNIQTALSRLLNVYGDAGTGVNTMQVDLDMNSNDLLNVNSIVAQDITVAGTSLAAQVTAAAASATAAATSETNAATSESNASGSATLASQWATLLGALVAATDYSSKEWAIGTTVPSGSSKDWAIEAEDVDVNGLGEYSAYHWAQKSQAFAASVGDPILLNTGIQVNSSTGSTPNTHSLNAYLVLNGDSTHDTGVVCGELTASDTDGNVKLYWDGNNNSGYLISSQGGTANADLTLQGRYTYLYGTEVVLGSGAFDSSAVVTINSTTKGFRPPVMTTAQRTAISSPADGLEVYDTDLGHPFYYSDVEASWVEVPPPITEVKGYKPSGTSRNTTTTLTNDPDLLGLTLDANSYYKVKGLIFVHAVTATPDIKMAFFVTNAQQSSNWIIRVTEDDGSTYPVQHHMVSGSGGSLIASTNFALTATNVHTIEIEGYIKTNASLSSDFSFQWAQNTSDANNTVVEGGSHLVFKKLS